MSRLSSVLCAGTALLALNRAAGADGFSYAVHGGCASGLAGAFIARACPNDPSSLFYNPAAIALVAGTRISLGATVLLNASEYVYPNVFDPSAGELTIRDHNETFFPLHVFASHPLTPRVTVGVGVFNPYGLGTEWPTTQDNVGRFVAYNTEIWALYTQPTVAVRLSPQIAVGAGLEIVYTRAELDRLVDARQYDASYPPLTYSAADAHLSADGWSAGFVASVLVEPSERVSIGLRYLSQTTVTLEGRLEFFQTPLVDQGAPNGDVVDSIVRASLPPGPLPGRTQLTLPDQILAGIEVRPLPRWTFGFTYLWTNWSDFDTLVVRVEGQAPDTLAPNFSDSSMFRVGAAYELTPAVTVRAGYIHDPTPADPANPFGVNVLLPDATRNEVSLGVGWRAGPRLQADVFWMGVFFNETPGCVVPTTDGCEVAAEAFRTTAHLLGASVNFAL